VPAKVARPLGADEARAIVEIAERYVALKERYRAQVGVGGAGLPPAAGAAGRARDETGEERR
jgi:hypothetical protein